MQSRIAVLLAADVVGYSALMSKDNSAAIDAVQALKNHDLEPIVTEMGGEVLKRMGDGWIIAFSSVSAALASAKAAQTNLYRKPGVKLRIGCHIGEVSFDENDFYGAGVNIVQRIQAEAPPGGLMISEDLFRQLSDDNRGDLQDAGTFGLKNITQPVRLYQWRPNVNALPQQGQVPSIMMQSLDFAPCDSETKAIAGDLREELIVRLSRRRGVLVFDGNSSRSDDAVYDLRGRLRLSGGTGRLTLNLTLRSEARSVWSRTYTLPAENIFSFCDEVLELAEGELRLQTNAFDGDRLAGISVNELSVSELRAKAANEFYKVTYESWSTALDLLNRALALNPDDGVSLAMRAEAQIMLCGARNEHLPADLRKTLQDDLDTAVIRTPQSDYVFWCRGLFRAAVAKDTVGAKADLARSSSINPAYRENHDLEGQICLIESNFKGAILAFSRLIENGERDPLQPYRFFLRGIARLCDKDYEGAQKDAAMASDLRPNEPGHLFLRAFAHECLGNQTDKSVCLTRANALDTHPAISTRLPTLPRAFGWIAEKLNPQNNAAF